MMNPKELALRIADILEDKKAENIMVLDVAHLTSVTEYFVICSARNTVQTGTMAEDVEEKLLQEENLEARRKEGYREARWVVLDYASVIVHVFHEQEREYYNIERLWMDGSNLIHQTK